MQTWIRITDTQYYQFEFLLFGCVCIYIYVYIHLKINKLVYYISYNNDGNNAWVWDSWTVNVEKSKHAAGKKKKKGKEMQTWIQTDAQYYWFEFLLFGCVCIYIYVYIHLKINKLVYHISYNNNGINDMLVEI